jgi:hypothetical protein
LQQDQPEPKVDFAGRFICAVDYDLHQVQDLQNGHGLGGIMMNAAKKPAPRSRPGCNRRFPRRSARWDCSHPEEHPGDDLGNQTKRQCAPPNVAPTRAARDTFVKRLVDEPARASAMIEPI